MIKHTVLDIGCNNRKLKGAIGIDIDPTCDCDYVCDAHDLHIFRDQEFEVVHIHQVLEHCYSPTRVMSEINRVLKDEGVLWLSIPNLRKLMRLFFYLRGKRINQTKGHIYAWDEDTLFQFIEYTGFKIVGKWFVDDNHKSRSRLFANRFLIKCRKKVIST